MNGYNDDMNALQSSTTTSTAYEPGLEAYTRLLSTRNHAAIETHLIEINMAGEASLSFAPSVDGLLGDVKKDHETELNQLIGPLEAIAQTDIIVTIDTEEHKKAIQKIRDLASMDSSRELVAFMTKNQDSLHSILTVGIHQRFPRNVQALATLALARLTNEVDPIELQKILLDIIEIGGFNYYKSTITALIEAGKLNATAWKMAMSEQLMYKALEGNLNKIQYLRAAGADASLIDRPIGFAKTTPLIKAATEGHNIEGLIAAGADINRKDFFGKTALMWALERMNRITQIEALLKAGTDLEAKDNRGKTALMVSASNILGHTKTLIAAGANIEAKDDNGRTALMWAVRHEQIDSIEALVAAGADPTVKDNEDKTALDLLRKMEDTRGDNETPTTAFKLIESHQKEKFARIKSILTAAHTPSLGGTQQPTTVAPLFTTKKTELEGKCCIM